MFIIVNNSRLTVWNITNITFSSRDYRYIYPICFKSFPSHLFICRDIETVNDETLYLSFWTQVIFEAFHI